LGICALKHTFRANTGRFLHAAHQWPTPSKTGLFIA